MFSCLRNKDIVTENTKLKETRTGKGPPEISRSLPHGRINLDSSSRNGHSTTFQASHHSISLPFSLGSIPRFFFLQFKLLIFHNRQCKQEKRFFPLLFKEPFLCEAYHTLFKPFLLETKPLKFQDLLLQWTVGTSAHHHYSLNSQVVHILPGVQCLNYRQYFSYSPTIVEYSRRPISYILQALLLFSNPSVVFAFSQQHDSVDSCLACDSVYPMGSFKKNCHQSLVFHYVFVQLVIHVQMQYSVFITLEQCPGSEERPLHSFCKILANIFYVSYCKTHKIHRTSYYTKIFFAFGFMSLFLQKAQGVMLLDERKLYQQILCMWTKR